MRRAAVMIVCAALLLSAVSAVDLALVSDMHYDAFYGTGRGLWPCNVTDAPQLYPFGKPMCDAPYRLVNEAWDDISHLTSQGAHVVVAGDWLRHKSAELTNAENSAAFSTIISLAQKAAAAGNATVMPSPTLSFGNNDVVPDYYFDVESQTRAPLYRNMTEQLLDAGVLSAAEHASFARCGYYSRVLEGALRVIVLNTLLWDRSLAPAPATGADPCGQFAFLRAELEATRAAGQSAMIVSHVPPTVNMYAVQAHPNLNASTPAVYFFQRQYERRYFSVVAAYNDVLVLQLFAHTHHFAFNADLFVGVPLVILGAVSPVYRNWPNYFHATVAPSSSGGRPQLATLTQHFFNMTSQQWVLGRNLADAYNTSAAAVDAAPLSTARLNAIALQLRTNASAWQTWREMDGGGFADDSCVSPYCRAAGSCFITAAGTEAFYRCLASLGF